MTTDEDLLLLLQFALDRFKGVVPDDKQLMYCIQDWRKKYYEQEANQEK